MNFWKYLKLSKMLPKNVPHKLSKKVILYFLIVFFLTGFAVGVDSSDKDMDVVLQDISQLRWKNRILIVFASDEPNNIISNFKYQTDKLDDRDIVWFLIVDGQIRSNYMGSIANDFSDHIKTFRLREDDSKKLHVVLIGKDGGIKDSAAILNFERLYTLIDGMPMRQREKNTEK